MSGEMTNRTGSRWIGWRRATHVVQSVLGLGLVCHAAAAQTSAPRLAKGGGVRVVIPAGAGQPERIVGGSLMTLDSNAVIIRADRTGAPESFVLDGGRRLEVAVTVGPSHPLQGLAIGAGVGALAGAAIGAATWTPRECTGFVCLYPQDRKEAALYGVVIGGVPGAVLGLFVGLATRDVRWVPAETAGIRIAVAPRGVGLAIAF
jgi:hypothetical protein